MPPEINIIVTLQPDGNINIGSNIKDKIILVGLLETAKNMILLPPKEEQKIVVPKIIPIPGGRG